jgi:hypothetical protein
MQPTTNQSTDMGSTRSMRGHRGAMGTAAMGGGRHSHHHGMRHHNKRHHHMKRHHHAMHKQTETTTEPK